MYKIPDDILKMIMAVRETGEVNMFDTASVQQIAMEQEQHELAIWLAEDENAEAYASFILTGEGANPESVKAYL